MLHTTLATIVVACTLFATVVVTGAVGTAFEAATRLWTTSAQPQHPQFFALMWGFIYVTLLVSILLQLANQLPDVTLHTMGVETNVMLASAWCLCAAWVCVFASMHSVSVPYLRQRAVLANGLLVAAAGVALVGTVREFTWRSWNVWRVLFIGLPYSVFAGWLCIAAALSVEITAMAWYAADGDDAAPEGGYAVGVVQHPRIGFATIFLVCGGLSAIAIATPDPTLLLAPSAAAWYIRAPMALRCATLVVLTVGLTVATSCAITTTCATSITLR